MDFPTSSTIPERGQNWPLRLVALALILMMQGPAMLMQEVAWAKMLVDYTQERGLKKGVVETFNGEHPCELCLKVREIRQEEQKQETPDRPGREQRMLTGWTEMLPAKSLMLPRPRSRDVSTSEFPRLIAEAGRGRERPQAPPPRWV